MAIVASPESPTVNVNLSPFADEFSLVDSTLNSGLGAFVIGLVLASISYGAVITNALSYFRQNTKDCALVKCTVIGMLFISSGQLGATVYAVYLAVVDQVVQLEYNVKYEWRLQLVIVTVLAGIAQTFFACRLDATSLNTSKVLLTIIICSLVLFEIAMAAVATVLTWTDTFNHTELSGFAEPELWAIIATFCSSAVINTIIAAVGYVWLQKPYVLTKYGKTTFMSELEYWTVKSLFGCALVSLFSGVAVGTTIQNLIWLAACFVLGNLYTLSVLLTLSARIPETTPIAVPAPARPLLSHTLRDRAPEPTLSDANDALWAKTMEKQAAYASLASPAFTKQQEHDGFNSPEYTGYHVAARHTVA